MRAMSPFLDELFHKYHQPEFLGSDPLEFVHRFDDPRDQEVVALVSALLAYGNVKQIRRSVEDLLRRMALLRKSPSEFVRSMENPKFSVQARKALSGFVHRFNRGEDIHILLSLLGRSWSQHGSLGAHFVSGLDPHAETVETALTRLISEWKSWAGKRALNGSFAYLLTSPADGSCCKRWCMFLRWMGRKDELDPGLWTENSPLARTFPSKRYLKASQLVIPLDTHTGRISQYLGLTERKSMNWLAALDVTRSLREACASDPTRYDFALARLGILDVCQRRFRPEICLSCQLLPACRFAQAGGEK